MRKCRPQARDVPLKGSGAQPSLKSPKPSEPLQVTLQWKLVQLVVTSANSRLAFFSEGRSIRNNLPFEIAFHSKWLRNNPKWPHGPIPSQGRRRRPWVPLGPLGSPWVPLGPLGSPWVPLGPLGSPWVPLGPLGPLGSLWVPLGPIGSLGSLWACPWVPLGPLGSPPQGIGTL